MTKALGLLSGGLDSSLATLTLKRQGIEVTNISFVTPFFGSKKAELAAQQMGTRLIIQPIGDIHLEMVKNPRYGYGKNMNPCVDCHAMMFRLAGEIMEREGYDFLFSGEVLGQRPMSQNLNALKSVANYAGYPDRILRPLSARLLPITPMEEAGLVDREQLLDIQGRSRKRQQELAKQWALKDYPSSGGGCLLTERSFSGKLKDLLDHNPQAGVNDVELLKVGRQFRLGEEVVLILGRNRADNETMQSLVLPGDVLLRAANFSGPLGLLRGAVTDEVLTAAGGILASYGKGKDEAQVTILTQQGDSRREIAVAPMAREQVEALIIL